jgi:hypothetical protein
MAREATVRVAELRTNAEEEETARPALGHQKEGVG